MILRTFPIEFVRQALEQTLLAQHKANPNLFGGKDQIAINSYFQQLRNQDEVDRFVECFKDIEDQQNRTGLIGNGIILAPENPTITNLYSCMIIPMEWNCSMRLLVENRDQMIVTLNNLIDELKGAKVDIAQLNGTDENGKPYSTPFVVGTIGYNDGAPELRNGDYIGDVRDTAEIEEKVLDLETKDVDIKNGVEWLYCEHENKLKVAVKSASTDEISLGEPTISSYYTQGNKVIANIQVSTASGGYTNIPLIGNVSGTLVLENENEDTQEVECTCEITNKTIESGYVVFTIKCTCDNVYGSRFDGVVSADISIYDAIYSFVENDGNYPDIIFPPQHNSFDKFKLSMSFDSLRCDTPRTLNGKENINISFGGSATLVNNGVKLGNDLIKIRVNKKGIEGQADFTGTTKYYLEPLEMPSGNNINTKINQLVSNNFKSNSHADAISLTLQYSFICDENIDLLEQLYEYGRFGIVGITKNDISPNMIYNTREIYSAWGKYTNRDMLTKVVESVDNENTESDVMTLSITMQIQGENH